MSDPFDVRYVARLARLDLSEEEIVKFQSQLGQVLTYVEQLKEVDVTGVEPTAHAQQITNIFRPDEPRPGLEQPAALSNAPRAANGLIVVPKVIE